MSQEEKKQEEAPKAEAPKTEAPNPSTSSPSRTSLGAGEEKTAFQKKSTVNLKPTECAACAKAIKAALWYYKNGAFYCNKRCYKRKVEETKKKAEEGKADEGKKKIS